MKNIIGFLLSSFVLFVFITIVTSKKEATADGSDVYGFPLKFYSYTGGKCVVPGCNGPFWNYINLILDLLITFVFAATAWFGIKKLKREKSN